MPASSLYNALMIPARCISSLKLLHKFLFSQATFFHNGDPGCDAANWQGCDARGGCNASNPHSFAPSNLNVSNWADSMLALGVTEAVLTAKHGCGFYLWPSNVTLPSGERYPYAVNGTFNVLKEFSTTMAARGLGHGFYYSLTNNFFLNEAGFSVRPPSTLLPRQANVTQTEFEDIVVASLTELWSNFGECTELWFDGGYQATLQATVTALLAKLQPGALSFNGVGISPSPGRWSGTEGACVHLQQKSCVYCRTSSLSSFSSSSSTSSLLTSSTPSSSSFLQLLLCSKCARNHGERCAHKL
jgi:hypothetical protein